MNQNELKINECYILKFQYSTQKNIFYSSLIAKYCFFYSLYAIMLDIDFKYKELVTEELESSSLEMLMSEKSICVHCQKTFVPYNNS